MNNENIEKLVNLLYEFDTIVNKISNTIDDIYNSDERFMEVFNKSYNFDNSYDEELIKHITFLYNVLREYGLDI